MDFMTESKVWISGELVAKAVENEVFSSGELFHRIEENSYPRFLAGLHKVHPAYRMVNAGRAGGRL
jgi:hypothetical protein